MSRFRRPNFGSISTGVLKASALIETFTFELRQQRPLHQEHRELLSLIDTKQIEQVDSLVRLISALNVYAPSDYYFGPSVSDASDFGFWPISAESADALSNLTISFA